MMGYLFVVCSSLSLFLVSCSQPEAELEPDYDSMVRIDREEESIWMLDEEKDRKTLCQDLPDPQELIMVEPQER